MTGTWYPPSLGTGGVLIEAQLFANPPFAQMTEHDPTGRSGHEPTPPTGLIISREPEFPGQVVWESGAVLGIAPDEATARADAAALAQPEPEVMPSDEEIMGLMPQQMHEDLATAARAMAEQAGADSTRVKGAMRIILNRHVVDLAHAAIAADRARFGRPAPVPAEGEVAELVAWLCEEAVQAANSDAPYSAGMLTWAAQVVGEHADLLECQAVPVPVASDVYVEFVVSGPDDCTQAGGIAPTYAQALSEGQHYLAQYQQDGPHTLEVRRVEVLPPGAFPVPDDAPVPLLPEDAQVIEPAQHTILAPAPVPVALSERPWEREGWCDSEGRCWIHCPGQSWDTWVLTVPQNAIDGAHCLPATALPLPSGEVQP